MTTRRDLLKSLLGAGVLAGLGVRTALAAGPVSRVIQIGLLLPPGSAEKGATMAVEEARQTAGLLNAEVRLGTAGSALHALVGETAPAEEPRVLFFTVFPLTAPAPVRPRVFHVASSPATRRRALGDRQDVHVADWHPDLKHYGADSLNLRFRRRYNAPMDEESWRGWMAVKIAAEVALRTSTGFIDDLQRALATMRFDGHKGAQLGFDPQDHHLVQPVYLVDAVGKLVREVQPE
ncbi:MAG TPA: hypothetical protein VIA62_12825 [Thermoanaerobaculia bacterium]|jgi:hypothetical protein|nr:hypothetical protein [Thermoanaerobaculia bacterium]